MLRPLNPLAIAVFLRDDRFCVGTDSGLDDVDEEVAEGCRGMNESILLGIRPAVEITDVTIVSRRRYRDQPDLAIRFGQEFDAMLHYTEPVQVMQKAMRERGMREGIDAFNRGEFS